MDDENPPIHDRLENDKGFQKKRTALTASSLLVICLLWSEASLIEANTFILRIRFENAEIFPMLFSVITIFFLIRYYNYAQAYHELLDQVWKARVVSDFRILRYRSEKGHFQGLMAGFVAHNHINDMNFDDIHYIATFPLRRRLSVSHVVPDQRGEDITVFTEFSLNNYSKHWTRLRMCKLLLIELEHRWDAALRTREYLDVYAPYAIFLIAALFMAIHLHIS